MKTEEVIASITATIARQQSIAKHLNAALKHTREELHAAETLLKSLTQQ